MDRLSASGQASAPLSQTGDAILELTAQQINEQREAGKLGDLVSLVENWFTTCKNARSMEERQWFKNVDMYQGRQFTVWDKTKQRMVSIPNLDYNIRLSVNIVEPIARTEMTKTGKNQPIATVSPSSNDLQDLMAAEAGEAVVDWWFQEMQFQTRVFTPANWWRTVTGVGFIKVFWDASAPDIAATAASELVAAQQAAAQKAALAGNIAQLYPDGGPDSAPPAQFGPTGVQMNPLYPAAPSPQAGLQDPDAAQDIALAQSATPADAPPPVIDAGAKPGRVDAYSVSPFHLYVPNLAELDLQRQPYLIHAYTMPIETARMSYGDRLPKDWNPSPINPQTIVDLSRLGIIGAAATQADSVLIKECWIKPGYSSTFPQGGLVIMCGSDVVHLAEHGLPYKHGKYPFAMITGIENGKFYRKAVVESITPLQNELNQTMSQIVKRKNIASAPQMFYAQGSVDPRRVTNKPGQWIPISLGFPNPTPVPVTETPQYVLDLLNRIRQFLDDISGQHQVSRATAPGANTPASALALLQEADDDFLSTTFQSIDDALELVGRFVLSLAVQFWDEARLIKITGRESAFDVKMLTGADLKNGTDLRMESTSGLPQSKTARIATITDWVEKGLIPAQIGLQVMEMGQLGRLYRQLRIDQDQANRENIEMRDLDVATVTQFYAQQDAMMAQQQAQMQAQQMAQAAMAQRAPAGAPIHAVPAGGEPAQGAPAQPQQAPAPQPEAPEPFYPIGWQDNDAAHMQQHADYAKGQAFKNLDPMIQRVFKDHYYAHLSRSQQLAMMGSEIKGEQIGATMKAEGLQPGLYANTQREALQIQAS